MNNIELEQLLKYLRLNGYTVLKNPNSAVSSNIEDRPDIQKRIEDLERLKEQRELDHLYEQTEAAMPSWEIYEYTYPQQGGASDFFEYLGEHKGVSFRDACARKFRNDEFYYPESNSRWGTSLYDHPPTIVKGRIVF